LLQVAAYQLQQNLGRVSTSRLPSRFSVSGSCWRRSTRRWGSRHRKIETRRRVLTAGPCAGSPAPRRRRSARAPDRQPWPSASSPGDRGSAAQGSEQSGRERARAGRSPFARSDRYFSGDETAPLRVPVVCRTGSRADAVGSKTSRSSWSLPSRGGGSR
jgi:hypothetical protein